MSDAPFQFGSVPPPPSAAPAKRGPSKTVVAVVALAALVAIGGAGVLISGAGHNADASGADATRPVAPSSDASASVAASGTSATLDQARIDAIIADAHTGKYFSNAHAAGYPVLFETGFVKGGLASEPNLPNAMAACMLSYVETTWSFPALMKHTDRAKQIGVAAGLHCVKYS